MCLLRACSTFTCGSFRISPSFVSGSLRLWMMQPRPSRRSGQRTSSRSASLPKPLQRMIRLFSWPFRLYGFLEGLRVGGGGGGGGGNQHKETATDRKKVRAPPMILQSHTQQPWAPSGRGPSSCSRSHSRPGSPRLQPDDQAQNQTSQWRLLHKRTSPEETNLHVSCCCGPASGFI